DRLRRQRGGGLGHRLRHQPCRLRDPQRRASRPARRRLRNPYPHARRHGGVGHEVRPPAAHAERDVLLRRRLPRLRGPGGRPRRAAAPRRRPRRPRRHGAAKPRPPRRRRDHPRSVHHDLLARARLPGAGPGFGFKNRTTAAGTRDCRKNQRQVQAWPAAQDRRARVGRAAAPGREKVPGLPRLKLLEGKAALVTGAGGGIGRDFALAMAAARSSVLVNDIGTPVKGEGSDAGQAQKVADEINKRFGGSGARAIANTDSVAQWESANNIVKAAVEAFGRLDVVVNNAGILRDRFFFNMSVEEWRAVIDVHLNGSFYVARAAAPHFKSQESGSYIHMTSTSGLVGNLGQANYSAAKLGI